MAKAHIDPEGWKRKVRRRWIAAGIAAGAAALGLLIYYLLTTWLLPGLGYSRAEAALERGELQRAIEEFTDLGGYRDARSRAAALAFSMQEDETLCAALHAAEPGDLISLGRFEQDGKEANGPEPIQWIVLAREPGRLLLMSAYVLDAQRFHRSAEKVTWADCDLRQWLNGSFYETAFRPAEQALIVNAVLENNDGAGDLTHGGKDTRDRVFLPSVDELLQSDTAAQYIYAYPSNYAVSRGVALQARYKTCVWWLRTPGATQTSVVICDAMGSLLHSCIVSRADNGVRPCVWVLTDSGT